MGSHEETRHEGRRRKLDSPLVTSLLAGAHFRARARISPESPKLETTRRLEMPQCEEIVAVPVLTVSKIEALPKFESKTHLASNRKQAKCS